MLFRKTRDQSETAVLLLERTVATVREASPAINAQLFWCKYTSYWQFGLFNHTYFTARNTVPTLVMGVRPRLHDTSHLAMVQFFRRVDGEEGAPSSSFAQDESACLGVFKKLVR